MFTHEKRRHVFVFLFSVPLTNSTKFLFCVLIAINLEKKKREAIIYKLKINLILRTSAVFL